MKKIIFALILLNVSLCHAIGVSNTYLYQPTGKYNAAFEDEHWINNDICPDPNFIGINFADFSSGNKKFCHEIMARVYYPTTEIISKSPYYPPLVKSEQEHLKQVIVVPKNQIDQLSEIKSFSGEHEAIANGEFPVILFSPGLGCQSEEYENFIVDLVSHGYIVVAVNSPFISGDIELPNKHIVNYNGKYDSDKYDKELMQITTDDFSFVFSKLYSMHNENPIFNAMDLHNIGALGHSIGGNIVANEAHQHTNWFKAAASLDIGFDSTGESLKQFSIPFMHEISANRKSSSPIPVTFYLGQYGYVIGVSPSEDNHDYSYHMNFSDESTLQYLPAYQTLMWWLVNVLHQPLPVGNGDGWGLTKSINNNLIDFFDTFLKDEKSPEFFNCIPASKNTYMICGPGTY